jgi:hypothetical protein
MCSLVRRLGVLGKAEVRPFQERCRLEQNYRGPATNVNPASQ